MFAYLIYYIYYLFMTSLYVWKFILAQYDVHLIFILKDGCDSFLVWRMKGCPLFHLYSFRLLLPKLKKVLDKLKMYP